MKKKKFQPGTCCSPDIIRLDENGNPILEIDTEPCIITLDENGNPIIDTSTTEDK